jgi:hypothetical protein
MLDWRNVPQPEAVLRILPEFGGKTELAKPGYLTGAPELIVELSPGRPSSDFREKIRAYRQNGVLELLVWRTLDREIDWFQLEKGEYVLNLPGPNQILRSPHFRGLHLNLPALMDRNDDALKATLRAGLNSPEHAAFISRLAKRKIHDREAQGR